MTGPALKQWDSHSSIHEAALAEAMELTVLLRQCIGKKELEKALEVAYITVEHWETRTLRHAESEEEGLYIEFVEQDPGVKEQVIALTRDHTLLRKLVGEIKEVLSCRGDFAEVIKRFDALILIDQLHNEEERNLINERRIALGKVT